MFRCSSNYVVAPTDVQDHKIRKQQENSQHIFAEIQLHLFEYEQKTRFILC